MLTPLWLFVVSTSSLLLLAAALHALKRLGPGGARLRDIACRAPALDVTVFLFTVASPIVGAVWGAWQGGSLLECLELMGAGVGAQLAALCVWIVLHEIRHRNRAKGPRIRTTLSRLVGPVRNHVAVWWTAWAVPVFALVRVAEYLVYPPLVWLVKFPKYDHGQWVNVSRVKFDGLVGYDLIWCLYCDWMTGVWSLGGEMLRNVESFWCPIRFASPEKCENCKTDFPDIAGGWVKHDASMADVAKVLESKYSGPGRPGDNAWFGHPARLTVGGRVVPTGGHESTLRDAPDILEGPSKR